MDGHEVVLTLNRFQSILRDLPPSSDVVIAYSGGADSHVLLHLFAQLNQPGLRAVHVHHGLSTYADAWSVHCAHVCESLGVPYEELRVTIEPKSRHSLEATAREARYQALSGQLSHDSLLITGHHQNDQAETVLLQLMRGAGVKGLSGMPMIKRLGRGQCVRPLLNFTRNEIVEYAEQHGLSWIEDDSNQSLQFDRNFIRQTVMPALESRRQGVVGAIARTANHMAEANQLINELARSDYALLEAGEPTMLSRHLLKQLSVPRQRNVLRYWLSDIAGVALPSEAILQEVISQLVNAAPDSHPEVRWSNVVLRLDLTRQALVIQ